MKIRNLVITAIAASGLALGLAVSLPNSSQATTSCVQLSGGHNNWECVGNDGLYWTDNLLTRQFYQHSALGQTAMEQFFCQNDQEQTFGHPSCKSNAFGVPANTPRWERRVITLGDGCTIYGWDVAYDNKTPLAPLHCTLYNGAHRNTTPAEKQSILYFWRAMQQVGGYW